MKEDDFDATFTAFCEAQDRFVSGDAAPMKALWSRGDDATVFGGFGGVERSWSELEPRLDWAASEFSDGQSTSELITTVIGTDMAYIVSIERTTARIAQAVEKAKLDLRVTQIFRREGAAWRLVHRHADTLVERHAP